MVEKPVVGQTYWWRYEGWLEPVVVMAWPYGLGEHTAMIRFGRRQDGDIQTGSVYVHNLFTEEEALPMLLLQAAGHTNGGEP